MDHHYYNMLQKQLDEANARIDKLEEKLRRVANNPAPTVPIYDPTNFPQDAVEGQTAVGTDGSHSHYVNGSWHTLSKHNTIGYATAVLGLSDLTYPYVLTTSTQSSLVLNLDGISSSFPPNKYFHTLHLSHIRALTAGGQFYIIVENDTTKTIDFSGGGATITTITGAQTEYIDIAGTSVLSGNIEFLFCYHSGGASILDYTNPYNPRYTVGGVCAIDADIRVYS